MKNPRSARSTKAVAKTASETREDVLKDVLGDPAFSSAETEDPEKKPDTKSESGTKPDPKPDKRFAEVHVSWSHVRDSKGRWRGLKRLADDPAVAQTRMNKAAKDYRRFLEAVEPAAWRVIADVVKNKRYPLKERLLAAQDVLNRLHGKVLTPQEAQDARKKVENMSTDELREFIVTMLRESNLAVELQPREFPDPVEPAARAEKPQKGVH